ncbi:MAG: Bug family tripartite tricarboxylate transporter substrate binding protein [Lautropia sp.]
MNSITAIVRLAVGTFIASTLLASGANAEDRYPSKPITFVLGYSAGGIGDAFVRQISRYAELTRKATIVVDYKTGAAGSIAAAAVKNAAADGYTVGLHTPSTMMIFPHFTRVPYDSKKDFTYLGTLLSQPQPLYVLASSPIRAWSDVVAYAKANPGKFSWGTVGNNNLGHIVMGAAFMEERLETTQVPFRGGADAITALLGGHIDAVVSADFGPLLEAGKVRLIAETGDRRPLPDVPTVKDLGYSLSIPLVYGVLGPHGMSAGAVKWWDDLLRDMYNDKGFAEFCEKYRGVPVYASPKETADAVVTGFDRVGKAAERMGLDRSGAR